MARHSKLSNPDFAKAVAEAYVKGMSHPDMATLFDCHPDTIRVWVADPRVQLHAGRLALERVNRITRKIDGEMEQRLAEVADWDLAELLKVRKEYLERAIKVGGDLSSAAEAATVNDLADAMDADPDFAQELRKLLEA